MNKKTNFTKANFVFEELEPRLLLSADGIGAITESSVATALALVHGENENIIIVQQQTEQPSTVIQNKVQTDSRSELVIIDSRAPNFQQLHNDVIKAQQADCVMLNKGPFILDSIKFLDKILKQMEPYQEKNIPFTTKISKAKIQN